MLPCFCDCVVLCEAFYDEIKFEIMKSHLKYINMPFDIEKKLRSDSRLAY